MVGQGEAGDAHVLHDEGVRAYAVQVVDEAFGLGQFAVGQDGVEGHVDARVVKVGMVHEPPDVVQRVGGGGAGAEAGGADVHRVGPVVHGGEPARQVAGRGEEFYALSRFH